LKKLNINVKIRKMAQFVAINENVEVNKRTVLSFVNSMEIGKGQRLAILLKME